jgi:hypothetical protein
VVGGVISIQVHADVVFSAMNQTKDSAVVVEAMSWACKRSPKYPQFYIYEHLGLLGHWEVVIGPSAAVVPKVTPSALMVGTAGETNRQVVARWGISKGGQICARPSAQNAVVLRPLQNGNRNGRKFPGVLILDKMRSKTKPFVHTFAPNAPNRARLDLF